MTKKPWWRVTLNDAQDLVNGVEDEVEKPPVWRRALDSVQDVIDAPVVKTASSAGRDLLNVAAMIGQANLSGPLGVAGAVVGVMDTLASDSDDRAWKSVTQWLDQRSPGWFQSWHPVLNMLLFYDKIDGKVVFEVAKYKILEYTIGHTKLWIVRNDEEIRRMALSGELDLAAASSLLWDDHMGKSAQLSMDDKNDNVNARFRLTPFVGVEDNLYIPPPGKTPQDFANKIRKFQSKGISRSYLVVGPPGSGKTTMCQRVADCLMEDSGRFLVITTTILKSASYVDKITDAVSSFRPTVLLLEDIDRVGSDGEHLLTMIDQIRKRNPDMLLISTANHPKKIPDAMKRPGRLGTRLRMGAPGLEWREKVIKGYCERYGARDITHLAPYMDHPRFTHDYIRDVCENAIVEDDEELLDMIRNIKINLAEDIWSGDAETTGEVLEEKEVVPDDSPMPIDSTVSTPPKRYRITRNQT